jgi:hypothetical protein
MSAAAKARPDAPRNDSATGNTQQLNGSTEKNAESTETPFATPVRETFITVGPLYFIEASSSLTFASKSLLFNMGAFVTPPN